MLALKHITSIFSYHSSLRHRFDNRHPKLGEFLLYIQTYNNSIARKIRNIRLGIAFPKQRREIDIHIDNQILEAVRNFDNRFYHQANAPVQHSEVVTFTHRIADLIGQHDQSGLANQ